MRRWTIFVPILFAFSVHCADICLHSSNIDQYWERFKKLYQKSYTAEEEPARKSAFEHHVADIVQHNLEADLGIFTYRRGVNEYTDLDSDEYSTLNGYKADPNSKSNATSWTPPSNYQINTKPQSQVTIRRSGINELSPLQYQDPQAMYQNPNYMTQNMGYPPNPNYLQNNQYPYNQGWPNTNFNTNPYNGQSNYQNPYNTAAPNNNIANLNSYWNSVPPRMDWRDYGVITPVKNQGRCSSCWTFSATGALEAQIAMRTGTLVPLSEQHLLDCTLGNHGCLGGWMDTAFEYVQVNGVETESEYPYTGQFGRCSPPQGMAARMKGYYKINYGDEKALQMAVALVGPIAAALDASNPSFHTYQYGIYYEPLCSPDVSNHAVLVVGYGSLNGIDYWLVKNSWGPSWGLNGYMMLSRNMNNHCGIATVASFPTV